MTEVKWIKIVVDIFDDDKIKLIEALPDGDSIIVCWFKLLCLAGQKNNCGILMLNDRIAYTDEMLATVFRRPLQTVRLALETFEQFGMIEIINGAITIPNWEKHQNLDKLEKVREQTKARVQRYRERQKLLTGGNVTVNATETQGNATDIDKDIDKDKEIIEEAGKPPRAPAFKPPTVEEVAAYCQERQNGIDPEAFVTFYEGTNWFRGKTKIKDWKACVRTWEKRDRETPPREKPQPKPKQYTTAAQYEATKPKTIDADKLDAVRAAFGL